MPPRLRALFATIEELRKYAQRVPQFLKTLGFPTVEAAWQANPRVQTNESVRAKIDRLFERQQQVRRGVDSFDWTLETEEFDNVKGTVEYRWELDDRGYPEITITSFADTSGRELVHLLDEETMDSLRDSAKQRFEHQQLDYPEAPDDRV